MHENIANGNTLLVNYKAMEAFDKIIQQYGLGILLLAIYSRLKYGGRNLRKYERWDKIRKEKRRKK